MGKQRWEKVAALWKGKKPGVLTGQLEGVLGVMLNGRRVILQENDRKEGDSGHPDFFLSLAPDDDEQDQGSNGGGGGGGGGSQSW
tara:strand:+ start:667 stop:921 length:255 start_codon:yes stop_codon:yes gene_type:complete